jgi:IS30 family transposase
VPVYVPVVVHREFWRLVGQGWSTGDAAGAVGMSQRTGSYWFNNAGGMSPLRVVPLGPAAPNGCRLTMEDREWISVGVILKMTVRAIADMIERSHTTVQRELDRNRTVNSPSRYLSSSRALDSLGRRVGDRAKYTYNPRLAHRRAELEAKRPKTSTLAGNDRLREHVADCLVEKFSPEQIQNRLILDFPDDLEMRVSHETIYKALYVQGKGALRRELTACLRTGRALRKPRAHAAREAAARGEHRIPGKLMIAERPDEVDDRIIPGHWEGDLICGTENKSAIGTLVERVTGFVILLHLPHDHGALAVQEAMIHKMSQLPQILLRTWDQGIEMRNHAQITAATGLDIYFCDPHSPWQRGTNENTNGLLRQYFPKGTDLSGYHPDYLDYVAAQLNNRPRKRHDWRTPAEKLDQLLSEPFTPPTGALTA